MLDRLDWNGVTTYCWPGGPLAEALASPVAAPETWPKPWNGECGLYAWTPNSIARPSSESGFPFGRVRMLHWGRRLSTASCMKSSKYDHWWLKVRSNAPYLIPAVERTMAGSRVFMEDYVRDPETGKPLVWDEEERGWSPLTIPRGRPMPWRATYEVNGQRVKTCLQALKDYVVDFTPEWASEITTIPAAKIREIAANLVREARIGDKIHIDGYEFPYSPACIDIGRGAVTDGLGTQTYKFYCAVNVLLGNSDVPGGMQGCQTMSQRPFLSADKDGILKARFR